MELLNEFQLFSFFPVLAIGGVFWYERVRRQSAQKRTRYLFLSLVSLICVALVQVAAWVFRSYWLSAGPLVFVLSGLFYFLSLIFLEYAIHVKRIDESFLANDFRREAWGMGLWLGLAALFGLVVLLTSIWWSLVGYAVCLVVAAVVAALRVFNLQEGVIRKRVYPFYAQIVVTLLVLTVTLVAGVPAAPVFSTLPLMWYFALNLVYVVRLLEEFFFWSQYNLRSDRHKFEQRQHVQNLLIRRIIGSADEDDKVLIREIMEAALDKVKGRLVVEDYQITGLAAYRAVGSVYRIDDPGHLIGYCTPLTDKDIKHLDKHKLTDLLLRATYEAQELKEAPGELKDFGKQLIAEAMARQRTVVSCDLPEALKGLQRLVVVVPILDSESCLGFLTAFKDSFDRLYPGEKDVLEELAENLATVYALIAGKESQKERHRLRGEMQVARDIQTSILPKNLLVPGYRVATFTETATEVGGDVFDVIPTPFGTYFGIGDVAGHGLSAGMMAVISVAALHGVVVASSASDTPLSLDQVYDSVNRVLCTLNRDRIGSDKFMTQNYFLATDSGITHVGTHLVALVWRALNQEIEELSGLAQATGFLGLSELVVSKPSVGGFALAPRDVLVLYTDGVTEARNGNGTFFGLDGLKQVLADHADNGPDEIVAAIVTALRRHSATGDLKKYGGRFADDVSLVVLKKD